MPEPARHVVLLGAGASKEAGVPTTFEATEELVSSFNSRRRGQHPPAAALHFVCGALLAYDAARGQNPFSGLDIERVFTAVQLLAERNNLEVSPFVSSWHPAVDALDRPVRFQPGMFDRQLSSALVRPHSFAEVEDLILDLIDSRTGSSARGEVYQQLAQEMVSELRLLVATTPKRVSYLDPLIREARRAGGLTIATLNYDLAIEHAAASLEVACSTGIEHWIQTGRWHWPPEGLRLLKLHGSIDWAWHTEEVVGGQLPRRILRVADDPEHDHGEPALVFGQREKLRAEGPFLGLLFELEALMEQADHLIVIGYSFRDDHVNELIKRWTYEDPRRTICVVDPNWPEYLSPSANDFRATLQRYLVPPESAEELAFSARFELRRERCSEAVATMFD